MPVYYNEAVKKAKKASKKSQKSTESESMAVMNEGKKARLTKKGGDSKRSDK